MTDDSTNEIIRRKFTLAKQLDEDLERMAKTHYQGNVSLCLRQAITDHQETLNGTGRLTMKRLARDIVELKDQSEKLTQTVERLTNHIETENRSSSEGKLLNGGPTDTKVLKDASRVVDALERTEESLRVADLREHVESRPASIRRALGYLRDHGHVVRTQEEPYRYRLSRIGLNRDAGQDSGV
jgi:hypothetical protein